MSDGGFKRPADKVPAATTTLPAPQAAVVHAERARAVAAAQAAAASALPGQRERAIAEAASQAYTLTAPQEEAAVPEQSSASPAKNAAVYTPPAWSGEPKGVQYVLEVMKNGQIVETRQLGGREYFTFGRSPQCEMQLEHPSISRLHAVLQFKGSDASCFVYDCGSSHGSFLNKRRLKAQVYAPFRVGDMLKLGQSTRVLILQGPADLMPEEGLSRMQRHTLAALEAKEARKDRERALAQVEMSKALSNGISWGLSEEATQDSDSAIGAGGVLDWRTYASSHGLTDKQQKLADKVRRCENRLANLQKEYDAIHNKQKAMEELTPGQAAVLARNEQQIDKVTEEMEDLEEVLTDSIGDSIRGKREAAEAGAGTANAQAKPSRRRDREEDDDSADSSGDEFYDRTAGPAAAAAGGTAPAKRQKRDDAAAVEADDPASLFGKKEALKEERVKLAAALAAERLRVAPRDSSGAPPRQDGDSSAQQDDSPQGEASAAADPLDAFMTGLATSLEHDKVQRLEKESANIEAEMARCEHLLKLADPEGYFKEGTRAAADAKAKGAAVLAAERKRRDAAAAKVRERKEAEARKAQEAAFTGDGRTSLNERLGY
ncbi:hypothetical protein WJX73_010298 [Symbiochloris irregularis]|uniref:FHA domain-containing protein n=1 Tax=Symbiochloris irregularis TaxID=706552 RepID=A0AAW1PSH1_9CHLO